MQSSPLPLRHLTVAAAAASHIITMVAFVKTWWGNLLHPIVTQFPFSANFAAFLVTLMAFCSAEL